MTQLRFFAIALLSLALPMLTYAAGETNSGIDGSPIVSSYADAFTGVSEKPTPIAPQAQKAPSGKLESTDSLSFYDPLKLLNETAFLPEPQHSSSPPPPGSCVHRCPLGLPLQCPAYIGVPPAACINKCCEYE